MQVDPCTFPQSGYQYRQPPCDAVRRELRGDALMGEGLRVGRPCVAQAVGGVACGGHADAAERGRTVEQGLPHGKPRGVRLGQRDFLQRGAFGKKSIRKRRDILLYRQFFQRAASRKRVGGQRRHGSAVHLARNGQGAAAASRRIDDKTVTCLLYTSDAADE